MRELIKKAIVQSNKRVLIIDIIALPMTVLTLLFVSTDNLLVVGVYFFSSYALTVTVAWLVRFFRYVRILIAHDRIKALAAFKKLMGRNPHTRHYLESKDFRAVVSLYAGLGINVFYAVFKGVTGIYYGSPWQWSMGIYYLFLGSIRFLLMRKERQREKMSLEQKSDDYGTYRLCGVLMLLLDTAIGGMVVQMIWQNQANSYPPSIVIISAAYTFYYFFLSIYNVVSFRKRDNAILSAAKDLSFSCAVMSMYFLQTTMLQTFKDAEDDGFRRIINTLTGIIVIAVVLIIAVYMIIKGTKKLNRLKKQG